MGLLSSSKMMIQMMTTTLLTLLLPLSFLLLARLSTAHYLLSVSDDNYPSPQPTFSFFLHPTILHVLVSLISVSTLTHALTGKSVSRPPCLCAAWIFLCVLQVCVGLGIEGSISDGIDGSGFGLEKGIVCRVVFFLGLHETTLFWWRMVVKPVVDDTMFGKWRKEEGWREKAAIGLSYGWVWWWRVREEVESLVVVPEVKRELMMGIGVADFMGWWLYYLTVTIGIVRVVKATVMILTRKKEEESNDDKV